MSKIQCCLRLAAILSVFTISTPLMAHPNHTARPAHGSKVARAVPTQKVQPSRVRPGETSLEVRGGINTPQRSSSDQRRNAVVVGAATTAVVTGAAALATIPSNSDPYEETTVAPVQTAAAKLDEQIAADERMPKTPLAHDIASTAPSDLKYGMLAFTIGGITLVLAAIAASVLYRDQWPRLIGQTSKKSRQIWGILKLRAQALISKSPAMPHQGNPLPRFWNQGMQITFDQRPFEFIQSRAIITPPGRREEIIAVTRMAGTDMDITRLYLGEDAFLDMSQEGDRVRCRFFRRIDTITPTEEGKWNHWLHSEHGEMRLPEITTPDRMTYRRIWNPGGGSHEPYTFEERLASPHDEAVRPLIRKSMLFGKTTGMPTPAPAHTYLMVSHMVMRNNSCVEIYGGMDIDMNSIRVSKTRPLPSADTAGKEPAAATTIVEPGFHAAPLPHGASYTAAA